MSKSYNAKTRKQIIDIAKDCGCDNQIDYLDKNSNISDSTAIMYIAAHHCKNDTFKRLFVEKCKKNKLA